MLQFEPSWRFTSPGAAPPALVNTCLDLIEKIKSQAADPWRFTERAKRYFGSQNGSSSESWAWSDLIDCMHRFAENAPLFIAGFYDLCEDSAEQGLGVPDVTFINRVLAEYHAGYEIRPPHLVASKSYTPVAVPKELSLAEQVRALIEDSLAASERFLNEGQGRRAVQEILFLLALLGQSRLRGPKRATVAEQGVSQSCLVQQLQIAQRHR